MMFERKVERNHEIERGYKEGGVRVVDEMKVNKKDKREQLHTLNMVFSPSCSDYPLNHQPPHLLVAAFFF